MDEGSEKTPCERIAEMAGRDAAEVAAVDRFLAGLRELNVSKLRLDLAVHELSGATERFASLLADGLDRDAHAMLTEHPELVEADVYLDGFYG